MESKRDQEKGEKRKNSKDEKKKNNFSSL